MPLGVGVVQLRGTQAFVQVSVPETAMTGVMASTPLGTAEWGSHKRLIEARLVDGFQLVAVKAGDKPEIGVWKDIQFSQTPATAQSEAIFHVTAQLDFSQAPEALNIRYALWSAVGDVNTIKLDVRRWSQSGTLDWDVALMSKGRPEAKVLLPWNEMLAGVMVQGFDHIMGGPDHLLFLITLLASRVVLRRWLVLLTAFTVAHGATFSLATLGWVSVPAQWVEPAIAASIVLLALMQLSGHKMGLWAESVSVFALGLIHGLGFASAMHIDGEFESPMARFPVTSLLGFNLGVEMGQITVAAMAWAVLMAVQKTAGPRAQRLLVKANLWFAAMLGSYWVLERIFL